MHIETKDGKTYFYLEDRISSANADSLQKEIDEALGAVPSTEAVVDAKNLEYISSAGLRVLLHLAKKQEDHLTILNVAPEVYEVFEMTGVTDILKARHGTDSGEQEG